MHENHASIVALHRLKTFFKKSADTFASTQYYAKKNQSQERVERLLCVKEKIYFEIEQSIRR